MQVAGGKWCGIIGFEGTAKDAKSAKEKKFSQTAVERRLTRMRKLIISVYLRSSAVPSLFILAFLASLAVR
jgi:hypothetical protein